MSDRWFEMSGARFADGGLPDGVGDRLRLMDLKVPAAKKIAKKGLLERIAHLELYAPKNCEKLVLALLRVPPPGLQTLRMREGDLGDSGASTLAAMRLPALRHLDLYWNGLTTKGIRALGRSEGFPKLVEIGLGANGLRFVGLRALTTSPLMTRLESLDVTANHLSPKCMPLVLEGAGRALRRLNLSWNTFGEPEAAFLAAHERARQVESLDLSRNVLTASGVAALGRGETWHRLKSLALHGVRMGSVRSGKGFEHTMTAVQALASSKAFPKLETLELGANDLDEAEARRVFGHSKVFKNVVITFSD